MAGRALLAMLDELRLVLTVLAVVSAVVGDVAPGDGCAREGCIYEDGI